MKKSVLIFIAFCLAFSLSLGFIYTQANPAATLPEAEDLLWHAHVENEYGTYNGSVLGDLFTGEGDFAFLSGETYTGQWSESYMSGNGELVFPGVGTYTGEMDQSKRSGTGTFTWDSGEKYHGNWENDAMSGEGTYTFANGSVLQGTFAENKPVSGTFSYQTTLPADAADTEILKLTYTFSEEERTISFQTKGTLSYNGDVSGLYATGTASVTYPSGNTYSGELSAGKRNGTGTYTWVNTQGKSIASYEGSWKDDQMNGTGKYHYGVSLYPYLEGSFENGIPTGTLVYYKAAGNTFDTTWRDGSCTSIKET